MQSTLSRTKQVGLFPCRGPEVPCRTLPLVSRLAAALSNPGFLDAVPRLRFAAAVPPPQRTSSPGAPLRAPQPRSRQHEVAIPYARFQQGLRRMRGVVGVSARYLCANRIGTPARTPQLRFHQVHTGSLPIKPSPSPIQKVRSNERAKATRPIPPVSTPGRCSR
jgi:hypothetical protein